MRAPGPTGPHAVRWSSQLTFVMVAAGSVIGFGNVWRFPFLAGRYGGAAFVLVYLATLILVALPLLAGELMIGRRARQDPPGALAALARSARRATAWQIPAWIAVAASLLVLAIYAVVSGWAAAHFAAAVSGAAGLPGESGNLYSALLSRPIVAAACPALFLTAAGLVAAGGVPRIERVMRVLVPALGVVLVLLVLHAAGTGRTGDAAALLLATDFASLGTAGFLEAVAQACFTLSLGLGVMTAYGAALPEGACIPRTAVAVAGLDLAAALAAAMGVLPFVLAAGFRPSDGSGLVFTALPAAFAAAPGGAAAAALLFLMLLLAAFTSAVPLLEPAILVGTVRLGLGRRAATAGAAVGAGVAAVAAGLAFNRWAGVQVGGRGLFAIVNDLASDVLLPLAAAGVALFIGYVLTRRAAREEMGLCGRPYLLWWLAVRWAAPAVVVGVTLLRWM